MSSESPGAPAPPVRQRGRWAVLRGWLLGLAVLAGALAAFQLLVFRKPPLEVRATAAARGTVEQTISSTKAGSVRSRRAADLSVDLAGVIRALHVREGDRVRQGARLLSLDRRDAEAALAAAEQERAALAAAVAEWKVRRDDTHRERDRIAELYKSASASQAELDQAQTRLDANEALLLAARARLEAQGAVIERARVALAKCELAAPFDGIIAARFVEVGEWATPGKVAFRLIDTDRLYVRAELDEVDVAGLRLDLPARVVLDPWRDRRLPGRVTRIAPFVSEVEEQNRTVEVEIELSGGTEGIELRPGLSADVELILRVESDVLRVPAPALLENDRVLVVAEDGRARSRALRIGVRNWEYAQVLEGLREGEWVITSLESEAVKDGALVRRTDVPK
jgi:HlyD family secretion protein